MRKFRLVAFAIFLGAQDVRRVFGDESCWQGPFAQMRAHCCKDDDPTCWDPAGDFTWDRCCLDVVPPGDPQCFLTQYKKVFNYFTCCDRPQSHMDCFDAQFTFARCCGGHAAVLKFGLWRRLKRWSFKFWDENPINRPWKVLAALSALMRLASRASIAGDSKALQRKVHVPAAAVLRVLSTWGIVGFHSLGNCGISRTCDYNIVKDSDPVAQVASSFLVLHTDVFFILSTYLAVVGASETSHGITITSSLRRRHIADFSAAILRRVARTAPSFVIAASVGIYGMGPFLSASWHSHLLGITWPFGKPHTWPFGIELLCFVVLQALLLLQKIVGKIGSLSFATLLLALCLERRRQHGPEIRNPNTHGQPDWMIIHVGLVSHRLPLCLATLSLTSLFITCQSRRVCKAFSEYFPHCLRQAARSCCLLMAWGCVALGMAITTAIEWCWNFGPRSLLPWWIYPFPAKLPLLIGCVVLLDVSRRYAEVADGNRQAPSTDGNAIWLWLERRSLGVLVMHEIVEHVILESLQPHPRNFTMFWFELPAVLVWTYVIASVFVWIEQPFRAILDHGVAALHKRAVEGPGIVANGVAFAISISLTLHALRRSCNEPVLNPCMF